MLIKFTDSKPRTLAEAVETLRSALDDKDVEFIKTYDSCIVHHGFGTALRNGWIHGAEMTVLAQHFRDEFGLGQPDDMSGMILSALWAGVRGETYDAESDADHYRKFWLDQNLDPLTQRQLRQASPTASVARRGFFSRLLAKFGMGSTDDARYA